jgi:hypothetical protein
MDVYTTNFTSISVNFATELDFFKVPAAFTPPSWSQEVPYSGGFCRGASVPQHSRPLSRESVYNWSKEI